MPTLQSKIRLCKGINVDRNYVNVLNYSEQEMLALCESNSHLVASANDYSFIRNKGTISTGFSYSDALQSNYIAFQNKDYSNKWFFAWIDDVIYNGENNTEIKYTIDAWSTWFSYWTAKTCFVEREHVNDDTIGLHVLDENLDIGDVVAIHEEEDASLSEYYWIAMETAWEIKDDSYGTATELESQKGKQYEGITVYNKLVYGNKIIIFKINDISSFVDVYRYITRTNVDGHIGDLKNLFIIPDALIDQTSITQHTAYNLEQAQQFTWYTLPYTDEPTVINFEYNKPTSFTGLNIKNNKCFCYPYNYLYVTNNIGNSNIYKYENFYNSTKVKFELDLAMCIGGSGRLVPKAYKMMTLNDDESLPLGKYPVCGWSADAFTNWLTQNALNLSSDLVFGALGMGGQYKSDVAMQSKQIEQTGSSTIAPEVTLGIGVAGSITKAIGTFYQGAMMPNIQGSQNTGDVLFSSNRNCFTFKFMRARDENLLAIDDYFTRFGYKINRVKVPNITGRTYWNYVEIGASEDIGYGDVPSIYMEQINNACRKGVTIWHNHANIGNYSLNNTIVT